MEKTMPIKQTYDMAICVASYMVAGKIYEVALKQTVSFMTSFLTLAIIAILVFYIKKWLAKEDARLNKDGGMIDFIKAYIKEKYKDECTEDK